MENLPLLRKVSFNHRIILFCSSVYIQVSQKTLYQCSVSVCTHWLMRLSPTPPYSTISCQPLFDFQALELCSHLKILPKTKRNSWARHLHFSLPTTLRFESFLPSVRTFAAHKSHLRRGGRTWYSDSNWNCIWTKHIWRIKLHNGPHCIPKKKL